MQASSGRNRQVHGERLAAPHSAGNAPPDTSAPAGAVDCHHHIFDARFQKPDEPLVPSATVADYRLFKRRLGIARSVFVASSNYGVDNACLVDALERFGTGEARGIAMIDPDVSDGELDRLGRAGVRGIRLYFAKNRVPAPDEVKLLARRMADRGWSINLVGNREREVLVPWEPIFSELPCPIVFDHFGWAPQPAGVESATAGMILRLLDRSHVYVKLSGPYLSSAAGPPRFVDLDPLGRALVAHNPDRVIWGSDWPHPVAMQHGFTPDGALLFDQLTRWAPDAALRRRVLVDNPERLYWTD